LAEEYIKDLVVEITNMSKVEIYPEKLRVMTTVPPSICVTVNNHDFDLTKKTQQYNEERNQSALT
jgi:hypothetical protein